MQLLKLKPIFSRGGRQETSSREMKPKPGKEIDNECEQRRRIVSAFENCLADRRPFNEIRDASELPYPKMEILAATAREIRYSDDDDRVQHLKLLAGFLADYQDNVGSSPLSLMGADDELIVQAGARHLRMKSKDLENYVGERARRGRKLPRGFQKVDSLAVESP